MNIELAGYIPRSREVIARSGRELKADFQLDRIPGSTEGVLIGIVRDAISGDPMPNMKVGDYWGPLKTDMAGEFVWRVQDPDSEEPTHLTLGPGPRHHMRRFDVELRAGQAVTIDFPLTPVPLTKPLLVPPSGAAYDLGDIFYEKSSEVPPVAAWEEYAAGVWDIKSYSYASPFNAPCQVEIPVDVPAGNLDASAGSELFSAAYWDGTQWVPIGGRLTSHRSFEFELTHFSKFTVLKYHLPLLPVTTEHFRVVSLAPGEDVAQVAKRLEDAWEMLVPIMGFLEPIPTLANEPIYVWIMPIMSSAGLTEPSSLAERLYDYVNYNIHLSAGLSGVAASATPAHEFFHVVQINGYLHPYKVHDLAPYLWWMEATASWIGSISADAENGASSGAEYARLESLATAPLVGPALDSRENLHPYLVGPFVQFLESKAPGFVVETWKRIGTLALPMASLIDACQTKGIDLPTAYAEFLLDYQFARSLPWLAWEVSAERLGIDVVASPTFTLTSGGPGPTATAARMSVSAAGTELRVSIAQGSKPGSALLGTVYKAGDAWIGVRFDALATATELTVPIPTGVQTAGFILVGSQGTDSVAASSWQFALPAVPQTPLLATTTSVPHRVPVSQLPASSSTEMGWALRHWPIEALGGRLGRTTLCQDPGGAVYVLCEGDSLGLFQLLPDGDPVRIWSVASQPFGQTVDVAIDRDGICHIVSVSRIIKRPEKTSITYYRISADGQVAAERPAWAQDLPYDSAAEGRIAVTEDGRVHVAVATGHVYYGHTDDGVTWTSMELPQGGSLLGFVADEKRGPQILLAGASANYYGLFNGMSWDAEPLVGTNRPRQGALALDREGNPQIVLIEGSYGTTSFVHWSQRSGFWAQEVVSVPGCMALDASTLVSIPQRGLEDLDAAIDSEGNLCVLARVMYGDENWGSDQRGYFLFTQRGGAWYVDPMLDEARKPTFLTSDGRPYALQVIGNDVYCVMRLPNPSPRLGRESDPAELWLDIADVTVYDDAGNSILLASLLEKPTVVVTWGVGGAPPSGSLLDRLLKMWQRDAFPGLNLVVVAIDGQWTARYAYKGFPFIQYQLDREEARAGGFEYPVYFFDGPQNRFPLPNEKDSIYYFDQGGPVSYLPRASSVDDYGLYVWLTEEIPVLKEEFAGTKLLSGLEMQVMGTLTPVVDAAIAKAWTPLLGGDYQPHPVDLTASAGAIEEQLAYGLPIGQSSVLAGERSVRGLLEVLFPGFYGLYNCQDLSQDSRAGLEPTHQSHVTALARYATGNPAETVVQIADSGTRIVNTNLDSAGRLVLSPDRNPIEAVTVKGNQPWVDLAIPATAAIKLDPEDAAQWVDGRRGASVESGQIGTLRMYIAARRVTHDCVRAVKILLFTTSGRHYVWTEDPLQNVLAAFATTAASQSEASEPAASSPAGGLLMLDWTEPFPGSGPSESHGDTSPRATVKGRTDAEHVLVYYDRGGRIDAEFETSVLPSLAAAAEPYGGLCYVRIKVDGSGPMCAVGAPWAPVFVLDGVPLLSWHTFAEMQEEILRKIGP